MVLTTYYGNQKQPLTMVDILQVRCVKLVQSRLESGRCCDAADELELQRWNGSRLELRKKNHAFTLPSLKAASKFAPEKWGVISYNPGKMPKIHGFHWGYFSLLICGVIWSPSLKLRYIAAEKGWLEDEPFLFGRHIFRGELVFTVIYLYIYIYVHIHTHIFTYIYE